MNKKGFTLTELIGVIVILAVIALISVPIINGVVKRSKERLYETQIKEIKQGAAMWLSEHPEFFNDNQIIVSIEILLEGDYLEENYVDKSVAGTKRILNPINKQPFSGCVIIEPIPESKDYTYEYSETSCTP